MLHFLVNYGCETDESDDNDTFFDDVMVMCEDEAVKNNRLALLNQLSNLFLKTADISRLQN